MLAVMTTTNPRSPADTGIETVTSAVAAAALAGVGLGVSLSLTDRLASVATLVGLEAATGGWVVLLVSVLVAGIGFAIPVALAAAGLGDRYGPDRPVSMLLVSSILGLGYGLALWAVAVAVVLPFWMDVAVGVERPFPYVHVPSLFGLAGFGLVVGVGFAVCYPATRRLEGRLGR